MTIKSQLLFSVFILSSFSVSAEGLRPEQRAKFFLHVPAKPDQTETITSLDPDTGKVNTETKVRCKGHSGKLSRFDISPSSRSEHWAEVEFQSSNVLRYGAARLVFPNNEAAYFFKENVIKNPLLELHVNGSYLKSSISREFPTAHGNLVSVPKEHLYIKNPKTGKQMNLNVFLGAPKEHLAELIAPPALLDETPSQAEATKVH